LVVGLREIFQNRRHGGRRPKKGKICSDEAEVTCIFMVGEP